MTVDYYVGIDVSLEASSICVVDGAGKVIKEAKLSSEPEAFIAWFKALPFSLARIGLEAGPLSQWLYAALKEAGFAAELLETRHVRDAFKAMPVKTDRNDARGIAQLMRLGWFRPVHCKSLPAQETANQKSRHRDEPTRRAPRLWAEGRSDDAANLPRPDPRTGSRPPNAIDSGRGAARGAKHIVRTMAEAGEAPSILGARRSSRAAVDDRTRCRHHRRAHLCLGHRRSRPLQVLQSSGGAFRVDPQEVSVGRD